MTPGDAPLILTAELPPDLHRWATALRTEHFPVERNYLEAHVTLFHALPPHYEAELDRVLKRCAAAWAPVGARLDGVMSLGRGTALEISSPGLPDLRDEIAESVHKLLTGQDQHRPRLHVTIQNKVTVSEARELQARLGLQVQARAFEFRGLALYRYTGGPWEPRKRYAFRGRT